MVLLYIILGLFILYSIVIARYSLLWKQIPHYHPSIKTPTTKITVIIAARNEEKNIDALLDALEAQTYSKDLFEVIVIDDHSTDQTAALVRQRIHVKLIQLKEDNINSYKKKAIERGIAEAKNELIITTDADCVPKANWLKTIAAYKEEKKPVLIASPVVLTNNRSVLQIFQAIDFIMLQGITAAAVSGGRHSMSNGANLAYEKKIFEEVEGFSGIDRIASGDDMLLMHKIRKKYPSRIGYILSKDAIVNTQPMKTWKEFFNQRIRWASKATHYEDKSLFVVLLLVYLFNLSFLVAAIAGFFYSKFWLYLLAMWLIKTIIEFPFLNAVARFFNRTYLLKYFFFFQPVHIAYTILSGLLGQFGKYEWKGRKVR